MHQRVQVLLGQEDTMSLEDSKKSYRRKLFVSRFTQLIQRV